MVLGSGCAKMQGPQVLVIDASQYDRAFAAAEQAARDQELPAVLRDRRSGVIETDARFAGSLLEPWRTDNASLGQSLENTLAFQRRRARFEFTPIDAPPASQLDTRAFFGPNVVGDEKPPIDLTQYQGRLELRAWVYLERAQVPGIRRSTWTRSKTTQAQLVAPEGQTDRAASTQWMPTTRDVAYERRLLAAVQNMLSDPQP